MKRKLKKQIAILALLMLVIPGLTTVSYAENEVTNFQTIQKSEAFSQWENLNEEQKLYTIEPVYSNIELEDSVKRSTYNAALTGALASDKSFNLKDELNNIYVKDQKKVGACWAFSYSNVIETTIANMYNRDVLEYSPMHIDYVTGKTYNRTVGGGGNILMSLAYGASGLGPVYESDFTFGSVYDETANSTNKYFLSDIDSVELNQESRARVEDATIFATIYKSYSTNSITYRDGNNNIYTEEKVKAFRQLVKEHIIQHGAVTASFYSDMGITSSEEIVSENGYYNNKTYAYYCNNSSKIANHAVTIVGWDDEFKKENFPEAHRPLNDGAYIVLNSWGEQFGNGGYFYVSYDDYCIEQALCGIESITETGTEEFYDYIYEYDQLGGNYAIGTGANTIYAANVFERQTEETEYLTEVGLFLLATQGVEVYVNSVDGDLNNCTLVGVAEGTDALESGYHTLKLSSPIELTGNKFAVKIKYINTEGAVATLECNLYDSGVVSTPSEYYTAVSNEGESFVSINGTTWMDLEGLAVVSSVDSSVVVVLKNTSACIKAFSTSSDGEQTVNVTGVTLDKKAVTLKEGETSTLTATVLPENATNKNIVWTSDDENVATVSNGVITGVSEGTAIITVTADEGNFTDKCSVTVESVGDSSDEGEDLPNEEEDKTTPDTDIDTETTTIAVTGVTLNKETATLKKGETSTLTATVLPENATNKDLIWSSNNENVATVSNGVITGESEGTATITVKTVDGNFTDTCIVTVKEEMLTVKVTGIELNETSLKMQVGERTNLVATIKPTNAINKNVTWKSSNPEVATISERGIIEALKEGKTTITVTSNDGNYMASCEITVSQKINSVDDIYTENNKEAGKIENVGTQQQDTTKAPGKIPNAGVTAIMILVIISSITTIIIYKKYKKYEDIY